MISREIGSYHYSQLGLRPICISVYWKLWKSVRLDIFVDQGKNEFKQVLISNQISLAISISALQAINSIVAVTEKKYAVPQLQAEFFQKKELRPSPVDTFYQREC